MIWISYHVAGIVKFHMRPHLQKSVGITDQFAKYDKI